MPTTSDMTLNETLAALGLTTSPAKHGRKHVHDSAGRVLVTGTAHEVWGWLRETGKISKSTDFVRWDTGPRRGPALF